ncbi:hypothetical protein GIB67_023398 [Kingdonia uniflora]|uniref:Uncharacterized protein n=1 Tax=Kingdonia uniflora TaxID=39325 RepID=A0A7J7LIA1_9MAGN|nr:hypothetical protein GIB67_023398 [Kingdonia uniflora]
MSSLCMFIGYVCDNFGDRSCDAKNRKIIQLIDVISNDDVFCEDMDKWTGKVDLSGSYEYIKIFAEIVLEPLVEKVQREPHTPPIVMKRRTKVSRPAVRYHYSRHCLWLAGIGDDYKVALQGPGSASNSFGDLEMGYRIRFQVWEALKILDATDADNPEASSDVSVEYNNHINALVGEHLWPRSYGLNGGPSLTDLHNIRPADVNVNSSRGNKYYGECPANSTHCLKPANKETAFDTETDKEIWAPPLQVRGDIARALMYMAICYGDGNMNLHLSDSPSVENREMGMLSTLLKWNELDPPSRTEQFRNNRVCQLYQHNRNPFVDHPEYADLVWKQLGRTHETMHSPSLKAWINEFHYKNKGRDQNEFIEVVVRESTNVAVLKLELYNGANGKIYRSLSLADDRIFCVTDGGPGFRIYTASVPLQNGPSDGISLVSIGKDDLTEVFQFVSYEGIVKATDGPAMGTESVDIGLCETNKSSENDSLGVGGTKIAEFKWRKFVNKASPMKPNSGQILSNL